MMILRLTTVCLTLLFGQSLTPPELERAQESLRQFQTAHIEWSQEFPMESGNTKFMSTRVAHEDRLEIRRGDWQGCQYPGAIGELWGCAERRIIENREYRCAYVEGGVSATMDPRESTIRRDAPQDILRAGTFPVPRKWGHDDNPDEYFDLPVLEYSAEWRGDQYVVSALLERGGRIHWELDSARDFLCTRCTASDDDGIVFECVTKYEDNGRFHFPSEVVYSRRLSGELVPFKRLTVLHASFDEPDHPASLGPEWLKMIPLTFVNNLGNQLPTYWWDGKRLITEEEWRSRRDEFDYDAYNDQIDRINAGTVFSQPRIFTVDVDRVQNRPGLWEQYVRAFIRRHRLDPAQTRDAWKVLSDAQAKARDYLDSVGEMLEEIDQQIENERMKLRASQVDGQPKKGNSLAIERLEARAAKLREPIKRIFHRVLKPSLVGLLNETQRHMLKAEKSGQRPRPRP